MAEVIQKLMKKNNFISYYLFLHTIWISFFCAWYFIADAYFGYELGDQIVVLTILVFAFLSLLCSLFRNKIYAFLLDLFIIISVFFDIIMIYLMFIAH